MSEKKSVIYIVNDDTVKSYLNAVTDDRYLVNVLKKGEEVTKLGEILIDGIRWLQHEQGFSIMSAFVKKDESQPDNPVFDDDDITKYDQEVTMRVTGEKVGIYITVPADPTDYSTVIGQLSYGQEVKVSAEITVGKVKWIRHDCGGWSKASFFEKKEEDDSRYGVYIDISSDNTNVYDSPNGNIVAVLNKGNRANWYKETTINGEVWTKINTNPEWWIKTSSSYDISRDDGINEDTSNAGREWSVTASVLNVRTGPGIEYNIVRTLKTADRVLEISKSVASDGVIWIRHDNGGWSCSSYLKLTTKTVEETSSSSGGDVIMVVTASGGLNVRTGPGVQYSVVKALVKGDQVIMYEKKTVNGETWIRHDNGGWSYGKYLKRKDGKNDSDLASGSGDKSYNINTRIEVRQGPGSEYPVVGYLNKGDNIIELAREVSGNITWICHGPERWSRLTSLEESNSSKSKEYSTVDETYYWKILVVKHDQTGVYSTPDTSQSPVRVLKKKDEVIPYNYNGNYIQVFNNEKWVNHDCGGWTLANAFEEEPKDSFLKIWTVTADQMIVRDNPSSGGTPTNTLKKGDRVVVKDMYWDSDGKLWIQHDNGGWSCTQSADGNSIAKEVERQSDNSTSESTNDSNVYYPDPSDVFWDLERGYTSNRTIEFDNINSVAGIFGLPYQFLAIADPRIKSDSEADDNGIGYEYAEKIIEKIPLLFLAPGKASFMTKYSKVDRENILEKLLRFGTGQDSGNSIEDLLDSDGRYYTFQYDQPSYYKYVNPMCRIAAKYLGIEDEELDGQALGSINWETFTQSRIKSIGDFGKFTSIPFYVDSDSSISESHSNSTTQSMIASSVNSVSDMGRELGFLLGSVQTETGIKALESDADVSKNIENIQNTISKIMGGGNFLGNLSKHLSTVAAGGKLVFPEIWSDSSFSRSYSCTFKFIAPDPSNLSVYINVLVPLFHLMGLVVPQSVKTNPNGYVNPFLVRAMYKGFFNVDMGIITSMSVTKGAECQWTPEGVPTSIVVNIDIKDLYSTLSITATDALDWSYDTMNNTALMDYIATLCGINIYKPEVSRLIEMWFVNNFRNRAKDVFRVNLWGNIEKSVQNHIMGIFRK